MGFNRRDNQQQKEIAYGCQALTLTSKNTGSTMLTVLDISISPGAYTGYWRHPESEESLFCVEGSAQIKLDGQIFRVDAGDCVLVPKDLPHGITNDSQTTARFITFSPHPSPTWVGAEEPSSFDRSLPAERVFKRRKESQFEFAPGIMRYDMSGDFLGAKSSYFSELTFQPGAVAQNHYHPRHEEAMFCLSGNLNCVYGEDDSNRLLEGDMFLCETGIRHGIFNGSDSVGKLLAIHPVLNPPPRVDVP